MSTTELSLPFFSCTLSVVFLPKKKPKKRSFLFDIPLWSLAYLKNCNEGKRKRVAVDCGPVCVAPRADLTASICWSAVSRSAATRSNCGASALNPSRLAQEIPEIPEPTSTLRFTDCKLTCHTVSSVPPELRSKAFIFQILWRCFCCARR